MPSPPLDAGRTRPRFPSRPLRSALIALVGGLGAVVLALLPLQIAAPERSFSGIEASPRELLSNGGFEAPSEAWGATGAGYALAPGQGRAGSQAIACAIQEAGQTRGAFQALRLDQTRSLPLRVSGWSRAAQVDGAPDDDYSLYVSVEFQDGSRLDRVSAPFDCGTHAWQKRELLLPTVQPVKSLVVHGLFRNHRGQVWFDDFSVEETRVGAGTILLEGSPVDPTSARSRKLAAPQPLETLDGLRLERIGERIVSTAVKGVDSRPIGPSGFLVRDAARGGAWQSIDDASGPLGLALASRWRAERDHLSIEGELRDLRGADRAVSLAFAVPVAVLGGRWADDVRRSREIVPKGEYVQALPLPCGSTGTLSRYPLAAVSSPRIGLALAADMDFPAQVRLGYHAELQLLFISYDFGILPDAVFLPGKARFRFVLYRFDPDGGFRGALARLYSIFPIAFARRCLDVGTWLPFQSPDKIPHWEDFGFAFRETAPDQPPAGPANLRSFRYTEPLGAWVALPDRSPRTQDELLSRLRDGSLESPSISIDELRRSSMKTAAGQPHFSFRREPWCNGAVFSLNPNPHLPGRDGSAARLWGPEAKERHYLQESAAGPAGEFIDSAEGWAMAELDFDREHLRYATVSPTFSTETRVPVLFKGQMMHEYASVAARELRELGKLAFGNGTPQRYAFLAPSFDILGAEVDWFSGPDFSPAADAELCFRRAMAYQKPCCILLNTRLSSLTTQKVELFFQRCLFYGMFPSLFSQDGQTDSYWEHPEAYERDRPLFRKYIPLLRRTAIAGWQPLTGARGDNPSILLERFGPDADGAIYLTLLNDSRMDQEGTISLDLLRQRRTPPADARELITETTVPIRNGKIQLSLPAGAVRLLEIRPSAEK